MTRRGRTIRRIVSPAFALAVVMAGIVASAPSAPATTCGGSTLCPIELTFYAPPDTHTPADSTLCNFPQGPSGPCHVRLRGTLYMPGNKLIGGSAKNNPLVVFVHGSTLNNTAPSATAMATFFTKHGYAFFAVHRRGHGDSTGRNLDGVNPPGCGTRAQCDGDQIDNLCKQVFEVNKSIGYLKGLKNGAGKPIIATTKIAILGHSLGGIVALCDNTHLHGQRTVIDIAAASESWNFFDGEDGVIDGHSPTIARLNNIVSQHVTPPMFLQPINDCSTVPTDQFSQTVADQDKVYEATLFPAVTVNLTRYGTPEPDCTKAHPEFVFSQFEVNQWGPSVQVWLDRMFVPPPP
jgi:Alpha/beta hydrolase family